MVKPIERQSDNQDKQQEKGKEDKLEKQSSTEEFDKCTKLFNEKCPS